VTSPAERWKADLALWAIPEAILSQAPESPWVHPPSLFRVDDPIAAQHNITPSVLAARAALTTPGSVLDVGCGGGGSSIGLAAHATKIIGVDEQDAMLDNFALACEFAEVNSQTFHGKWPEIEAEVPICDVVVCHHVVYNIGEIEPFLCALTNHARRQVVVELPASHPTSPFNPLWQHFWQLDRPTTPTADQFVEVVNSCGWEAHVERFTRSPRKVKGDHGEYVSFVRRRLCLGADRDVEIAQVLKTIGELRNEEIVMVAWSPVIP
jgi:ubiquinone/menaquinone biosynthesis C-methylase UbiE